MTHLFATFVGTSRLFDYYLQNVKRDYLEGCCFSARSYLKGIIHLRFSVSIEVELLC